MILLVLVLKLLSIWTILNILLILSRAIFKVFNLANIIFFIYFIITLYAFIWSDFDFLFIQNIQVIITFLLIIFNLILNSKIIMFSFKPSKQSSNHSTCLWSGVSSIVIKHYISLNKFLVGVYKFIHLLRFWNEIWILWFLFGFLFTFIDFVLSEKSWQIRYC